MFTVKFKFFSFHENPKENLVAIVEDYYEAKDLNTLFETLGNEEDWDDSCVFNPEAESHCSETRREYIEIKDSMGDVVYKDEDESDQIPLTEL